MRQKQLPLALTLHYLSGAPRLTAALSCHIPFVSMLALMLTGCGSTKNNSDTSTGFIAPTTDTIVVDVTTNDQPDIDDYLPAGNDDNSSAFTLSTLRKIIPVSFYNDLNQNGSMDSGELLAYSNSATLNPVFTRSAYPEVDIISATFSMQSTAADGVPLFETLQVKIPVGYSADTLVLSTLTTLASEPDHTADQIKAVFNLDSGTHIFTDTTHTQLDVQLTVTHTFIANYLVKNGYETDLTEAHKMGKKALNNLINNIDTNNGETIDLTIHGTSADFTNALETEIKNLGSYDFEEKAISEPLNTLLQSIPTNLSSLSDEEIDNITLQTLNKSILIEFSLTESDGSAVSTIEANQTYTATLNVTDTRAIQDLIGLNLSIEANPDMITFSNPIITSMLPLLNETTIDGSILTLAGAALPSGDQGDYLGNQPNDFFAQFEMTILSPAPIYFTFNDSAIDIEEFYIDVEFGT